MDPQEELLCCLRKTRNFRFNFEKMLATANYNKIVVMTAGEFRVIDVPISLYLPSQVLSGHNLPVQCLDVALIDKSIVSYSHNLLLVHKVKYEDFVNGDHAIYCGPMQWYEVWRFQLDLPIRSLNCSRVGDFFMLTGDGIISIWTREED